MNSKRGPNVDAREMLGNKNKNMDAREKLLKMRNLKVSFLGIILFHGFTPSIPFQKKRFRFCILKSVGKGAIAKKGEIAKKGAIAKKETIAKKGVIAK